MTECKQHHEAVTIALPILTRAIDQLLDFASCQMLSRPQLSIGPSHCSIYNGWRDRNRN
jgi:hypothetical protein